MNIDWTQAPNWARWHTEDKYGCTWWAKRPKRGDGSYYGGEIDDSNTIEFWWYDATPCGMMKLTLRPLPGFEVKK